MNEIIEVPFQKLLEALLDVDTPFNPRYLYRLSDLEKDEQAKLEDIWPKIPLWRRQALMEDINELSEKDTLLSFVALGRFATHDPDPKVRLLAVDMLWDYEETDLFLLYLHLLDNDKDVQVRAAAAGALGRFVEAGELEKISAKCLHKIEERLLEIIRSQDDPAVRRAALEAMGYSSRSEINPLIEAAYDSKNKEWIASALFAMGRSGETTWHPEVLKMLGSRLPSLRSEAARAAGELEIAEAAPQLLELLDDPDENTRLASIFSLSQIGGEGVRQALESLYEKAEDEHERTYLGEALENLAFTEEMHFIPIFDIPVPDEGAKGKDEPGKNDFTEGDLDDYDYDQEDLDEFDEAESGESDEEGWDDLDKDDLEEWDKEEDEEDLDWQIDDDEDPPS